MSVCRSVCHLPQHSIRIVRRGLEIISAPVAFHGCCPERRQEPAQLRVLRNSPRAMPLSGLPIIVMTALCTSRKQGKLQRACAYGGPDSRVQIRPFCPRRLSWMLSRTAARARSAARQDITAETPVNFGTNEHPHKAAKILIIY